eukprot:jgi/Bigna1/143829/aug1.81_g18537
MRCDTELGVRERAGKERPPQSTEPSSESGNSGPRSSNKKAFFNRAVAGAMHPKNIILLVLILVPGTVLCLSHIDTLQKELQELQDTFSQGMSHLEKVKMEIADAESVREDLRREAETHRKEVMLMLENSKKISLQRESRIEEEEKNAQSLNAKRIALEGSFMEAAHRLESLKSSIDQLQHQQHHNLGDLHSTAASAIEKEENDDGGDDGEDDTQLAGVVQSQLQKYRHQLENTRQALEQAELRLRLQKESSVRLHDFRNKEHRELLRANKQLQKELDDVTLDLHRLKEESRAREVTINNKLQKALKTLKSYETTSPTASPSTAMQQQDHLSNDNSYDGYNDGGALLHRDDLNSKKVGDRVHCKSKTEVWRSCEILDIGHDWLKVHYVGFDTKYDEVISFPSSRIKEAAASPPSSSSSSTANPMLSFSSFSSPFEIEISGTSPAAPEEPLRNGGEVEVKSDGSGDDSPYALEINSLDSNGINSFLKRNLQAEEAAQPHEQQLQQDNDNKGGQKNAQEKYLYIRFTVVKSGEGRGAEGSILKPIYFKSAKLTLINDHKCFEAHKSEMSRMQDTWSNQQSKQSMKKMTTIGGRNVVAITTPIADPEEMKGPRAYLGCFTLCEECGDKAHGVDGAGMTMDYCEILCRDKGSSLMELVYGDTCRCAATEQQAMPENRRQIEEEACSKKCTGDQDQYCGGDGGAHVFALTEQATELALRKSLMALGGGASGVGGTTNEVANILLKLNSGESSEIVQLHGGDGNSNGGNMDNIVKQFQQAVSHLMGNVQAAGGVMIKAGNIQFHMKPTANGGGQAITMKTATTTMPAARAHGDVSDSTKRMCKQFSNEKYAWGHDDVKPLSKSYEDNYGMALTMIDSLDTLILLGFEQEFNECVEWIGKNLSFKSQKDINLFETTIRVLGAKELGNAMLFAFDTPTGIPKGTLDLEKQISHNPSWTSGHSTVAEVGSIQMEFRLLSRLTGNEIYYKKSQQALKWLGKSLDERGLFTQFISPDSGRLRPGVITLGARVDSVYEYFLKLWVLNNGMDVEARKLYEKSIRLILEELTLQSNASKMTFIAEKNGHTLLGKMDHLVCFMPGLLAMDYAFRAKSGMDHGVGFPKNKKNKGREEEEVQGRGAPSISADQEATSQSSSMGGTSLMSDADYLKIAEELGETCYQFYAKSPTGIAPEIVQFRTGAQDFVIDSGAAHSLLRPEAVEAFYHLYRATGDAKWRARSWEVFDAIRKWARLDDGGYANLKDVRKTAKKGNHDDRMESFFLSETMKYIYLTLVDARDDPVPIEKYVFNTEAHAFSIQ